MGRHRLVGLAVSALILTGCSSVTAGSQDTSAPRATVTVTASPGASRPVVGSVVDVKQVSSPSGNIWCSLSYGFVECLIQDVTFADAPVEDCHGTGDWTDQLFGISKSSGVRGACQSDTMFGEGRPPALANGKVTVHQGNACQSLETGMTCWNLRSQHGFRLSKASYDLF